MKSTKTPASILPSPHLHQEKPQNNTSKLIDYCKYNHNNHSLNQDRPTEDQIKAQIQFDSLCQSYDRRLLEDIIGIMADVMALQADTVEVRKGVAYPADYVRSCLSKINALHIEQIMNKLEDTRPTIHNARGYLLSTLINAANTMSMTYQYGDY